MSTALVRGRGAKPAVSPSDADRAEPDILSRLLDEAERLEADERTAAPAPQVEPAPRRLFVFD